MTSPVLAHSIQHSTERPAAMTLPQNRSFLNKPCVRASQEQEMRAPVKRQRPMDEGVCSCTRYSRHTIRFATN